MAFLLLGFFFLKLWPDSSLQSLHFCNIFQFSSVQSLSHVWLFATPWTAAHQASLPITNFQNLLKLLSIESVTTSNHLVLCHSFSSCLQSFPESGSFTINRLFTSDSQSIGASASASVLLMNILGWYPLGLTGLISFLSKGLSRVFSSNTIQKHQFFITQPSLWSNSHIHTWLQEKSQLWLDGSLLAKQCLCFLIHCLGFSKLFFQRASTF